MDLDDQVERYLSEPVKLTHIRSYSVHRALNDVTTLRLEIIVDPARFEARDAEITSVNESGRTFMRPDGTTYTKE
jgi:hypothetical protein